ncbi:ABC transporter ATP-binding protein [Streptococcus dysgalactiae subsp. equisimilis]|uniref:ABC transporter ATP-binding protein n=1 Tax=Streptococcus TaxID=1301 RepID=UPI000A0F5653|nr:MULTISPECIES: ABC transporter ATP-binding protein [Streptococcus]MCH9553252.1 ABC transporter ATP-binding protein/permease [Streptococcus agalactiae]MCY7196600.1 ABC transporter ATP-binding protein/permease [Streptococcus dysgalactiae]MCY7200272.1 ABC transporter ATP-binding protein/permease [Streptococcus dysgalactiae]MCY7205741.1 ABC transporter ATP-binding protein/permease [Streptococcus dysgalactiae]MCY7215785.1 ABC transporter ATP-binding protein/permease [Streptococcus dysgalactiae]
MDILKGHKSKIFAAVFIAIIGVGFGVIPYFSVAAIINNLVAKNANLNNYYPYIFAVFLGFMASILFHEISTIISHNLAYRIIEDKRKLLADKLSKISMGEVERKSSGQWSQFMVETLDKMEKPIAHVIPEVIANIFIPIVLVITIFIMDWRIGIANLLTIPLGLLFSMLMMRGYEEKSKRYQEAAKAMNTTMVEYVNGIKVIKAFNKSASSFGKFRKTVEENKNAMLDWYLSVCFSMTATMETIPSTMVFVLPASLYFFMKGSVEVGTLIMCILLSYASYKPLIKAMSHMETIANIKVVFEEIKKIMEIPNLKRGEEVRDIKSYDVEFKDVTFAYEESKNVLNNISFKANENELTAIVGNSGGGKSTITKLIAGFWNVSNGEILIGKTNLNELPLKQNMELVSYVSQENFLFNKTILENLKMAKEDASMDEIEEACEKASCYNFIKGLPNGYETIVGKGGANLSGGEKQRIAIARCFLKNSPIVLLDEATAYSDPDNESVIQQSIDKLIKDKTVIMVAHRLSTIVNANKIIVVDNGEVIEEGTHKQLLELNGRYKKMWDVYTESKEIEVI